MKFTHPYLREKSYLKTNLSDARYCIVPKGQRLWQNEHFLAGTFSYHFLVTCFFSSANILNQIDTCAPAMPPRVRSPSAAKPPPSIVVARTSLTFVCCWIMGICSIPTSCPQPSFNSLLQNHPRHSTATDAVSRKILTLRAKQNPNCLNNPRNCQARSCQSE